MTIIRWKYAHYQFHFKVEQLMKKIWIKESTWIFLTKLCAHDLSEDIKILWRHYQKRSQQYAEEKNTFLRCEDLRVSWDLGFNPEKRLKMWKLLTNFFMERIILEKYFFHQHMPNKSNNGPKFLIQVC